MTRLSLVVLSVVLAFPVWAQEPIEPAPPEAAAVSADEAVEALPPTAAGADEAVEALLPTAAGADEALADTPEGDTTPPAEAPGPSALADETEPSEADPEGEEETPAPVEAGEEAPAEGEEAPAEDEEAPAEDEDAAFGGIDTAFGKYLVGPMASVLFFDVIFWDNSNEDGGTSFPLVVLWLVLGAIFFTVRMSFINLRGFGHAISVTRGDYDNPDDTGEISHFQALSSALSATVGLGNIAGVAIAVGVGGPGAVFWMICAGILGMSSKFVECTLGQMYRTVDDEGRVSGGPMRYLQTGLGEMGFGGLGRVLAIMFALMCIGGSLGGGNMFQANQSFAAVSDVIPLFEGRGWLYGILLAILVGVVILGGIKRIGKAASIIVPVMCAVYVLAAIWILVANASGVPSAFGVIVSEAFTPAAGIGGVIGVIVQGFRRAAFSNEAGIGSASIAHSAAATEEPVREGIVALLEPFIDTIIVCTMTGLVVVVTGAYQMRDANGDLIEGVLMTSEAFKTVLPWFPLVLSFAVVAFAFSTMISWSYYGERCSTFLFGPSASVPYKVLFLFFVFFGSVFKLGNVLDFSDLMVLGMAFPNILGAVMLSGKVKAALNDYWGRLKTGKMPRVKH